MIKYAARQKSEKSRAFREVLSRWHENDTKAQAWPKRRGHPSYPSLGQWRKHTPLPETLSHVQLVRAVSILHPHACLWRRGIDE